MIPGIVMLLQKQWRGYICRRRYKKMKAALVIARHYRLYKMRKYMQELEMTFRHSKLLRDYGKTIPWPRENFAVRSVVPKLRMMHARWRAWMILKAVPREDWPQLRLKVKFNCSICMLYCLYLYLSIIFRCQLLLFYEANDSTGARTDAGRAITCQSQTRTCTATFLILH